MEAATSCFDRWKPTFVMVVVDVAFGILNVLTKKTLDEGFNPLVLITLRQLTATVFMAPIALFQERASRAKLTWWILVQLFFSALLGASLTQYLFFLGLQHTSATFACAFLNMTPVFTFLIALPFRLERVDLRATTGRAKVFATAICIAGAMVLMFYKGVAISNDPTGAGAIRGAHRHHDKSVRWNVGSVLVVAGCVSYSAWFLVQARVGQNYPALYSGTAIMFFFGSLQAATLALFTQPREVSVWSLKSRMELVTVVYSGVVVSGLGFLMMSWCIRKRGPVFTAAFNPLIQLVVALVDFFLVRSPPHLGSILGSVLVVLGLYMMLWGKSKETKSVVEKHAQGGEEERGEGKPESVCMTHAPNSGVIPHDV